MVAEGTDPSSPLNELGTPPEVREERPKLYPEHAELGSHARDANTEPDDAAYLDHAAAETRGDHDPAGKRTGVWNTLAYWAQWTMLQVYGPAAQTRQEDPIEELKRKYGRPQRPSTS